MVQRVIEELPSCEGSTELFPVRSSLLMALALLS
jgi:hypothetical protein